MKKRLVAFVLGLPSLGCTPGYLKPADLERKEQGPQHCALRCKELGMKMGALVLVADQLPGCVCQPVAGADAAQQAASGATTSYAVVLAAAAAAQQQQQRQQQAQQYHAAR